MLSLGSTGSQTNEKKYFYFFSSCISLGYLGLREMRFDAGQLIWKYFSYSCGPLVFESYDMLVTGGYHIIVALKHVTSLRRLNHAGAFLYHLIFCKLCVNTP